MKERETWRADKMNLRDEEEEEEETEEKQPQRQ